jgi:uncharacterized protein
MDSQPSGNSRVELISIDTKKVIVTIKGRYIESNFNKDKSIFKDRIFIECLDENVEQSIYGSEALFYEYEDYEILIERKDQSEIDFYHENRLIRESVSYISRNKNILSGILNFSSDIGFSELLVKVDKKDYLILRIEVFPKKIDYKEDYINILNDVNEEIYNLSFEFLRRTYLSTSLKYKQNSSITEYYSILKEIYDELIKAINLVVNQPHHMLNKEREIVPPHKFKKCNKESIRWLNKHPEFIYKENNMLIPIAILQIKKTVTLDTYENRFMKYLIISIINKLKALLDKYSKLNRKSDELLITSINSMINKLNFYLSQSFLKEVGEYQPRESLSLVLQMGAGYKEIYKYYLMLKKGLTLYGDIFKLSMKELSLLYEYWCFIKLNSILSKKYRMISNDIIKINTNGIFVTLKKGSTSKVVYEYPKTGERFSIAYNMGVISDTVNQKPDNILSIVKEGNDLIKYNYIFDAKYKLNYAEDSRYKNAYGTPGPEEEDINTMHRYRDAIVYEDKMDEKYKRTIFGAFVLFPYKNEELYKEHPFYKSIEKVNIGGIPLLPSNSSMLENLLDELIEESSFSSFDRSIEQAGRENSLKDEYFNDRSVMVGTLRNKQHLQIILENNFYYTPLSNVDLNKRVIKKIVLAQSIKRFGEDAGIKYYGVVKEFKIVKRSEITEIYKDSVELYIRFEVEEWKMLNKALKVQGYPVRRIIYTTEYLLNNSFAIWELLIKSKQELRIWNELKRINNEVSIMANGDTESSSNIQGFRFEGVELYFVGQEIKLVKGNEIEETFSRAELNKRPSNVVKSIKELMN